MTYPHPPGQNPNYYVPPTPPTPPKPKRKWPMYVAGGFGVLFLVSMCNGDETTETSSPALSPTTTRSAPASPAPIPTRERATVAAPAPAPAETDDTIGDGLHIVGRHIEPGTYESSGAKSGIFEFCMWTTRDGASSNSDIIDFGSANADERMVVEITSNVKSFESNGCEEWVKID